MGEGSFLPVFAFLCPPFCVKPTGKLLTSTVSALDFFQGKSSICGFSAALCAQVVSRLKQQQLKDDKKEENSTRKGRKPKGKAGKADKAGKPAKARQAAKAGKAAKAEPATNEEQSRNNPKTKGKRLRRMKSQVRMVSNEREDGEITQKDLKKDKATPSAAKTRNPSSETKAIPCTTMSKGKGKDAGSVKEAGKTKKVNKGCKVKACKTEKTKKVKKAKGEQAMDHETKAGHAGKGAKAKKAEQLPTGAEPAPTAGEDSPLAFHLKYACLLYFAMTYITYEYHNGYISLS